GAGDAVEPAARRGAARPQGPVGPHAGGRKRSLGQAPPDSGGGREGTAARSAAGMPRLGKQGAIRMPATFRVLRGDGRRYLPRRSGNVCEVYGNDYARAAVRAGAS